MKFKVDVRLKPEVLDPEGRAILNSLKNLGHHTIQKVESFKSFILEIDSSESDPQAKAEEIAASVLANPVSHQFTVQKLP